MQVCELCNRTSAETPIEARMVCNVCTRHGSQRHLEFRIPKPFTLKGIQHQWTRTRQVAREAIRIAGWPPWALTHPKRRQRLGALLAGWLSGVRHDPRGWRR